MIARLQRSNPIIGLQAFTWTSLAIGKTLSQPCMVDASVVIMRAGNMQGGAPSLVNFLASIQKPGTSDGQFPGFTAPPAASTAASDVPASKAGSAFGFALSGTSAGTLHCCCGVLPISCLRQCDASWAERGRPVLRIYPLRDKCWM